MLIIPAKDETLVLPYDHPTLIGKLVRHINIEQEEYEKPFNGNIKGTTFKICQRLKRPDNYIPLISGRIEETSKGSILFLKYRLMFSTRMFLIFWSILLLLLSLFFGFKHEAYHYATISLAIGLVNYLIIYFNFKKKVEINHELIIKVLE